MQRLTFAARKLTAELNAYEGAVAGEDLEVLAGLAAACTTAEEALAEAVSRVHGDVGSSSNLSSEAAHLAALQRFANDDDNEETRL
ncbi:hypothetical protein [Rubellimicrobium mesophilum]|uniref:hypothetical protein n=1 Tax=Rubellimicrobium mesophilum TaxID=1123067 RepID=UPI00055E747D|nr:hypothetical protein [Rubellimicrobium mesophilum]